LEIAVVGEDSAFQPLQLRSGVQAELLGEQPTRCRIRLQGLALPTGAVQRDHQMRVRLFAERVARDQGLRLSDDLVRTAQHQQQRQPGLPGLQVGLVETGDVCARPFVLRHVGQRLTPPQRQRGVKLRERVFGRRPVRTGLKRLVHCSFEAGGVHGVVVHDQGIARCPRDQHIVPGRPERPTQVRHHSVDRVHGIGRRLVSPEPIDNDVPRRRQPATQQEQHSQRARQPTSHGYQAAGDARLQRSKNRELHCGQPTVAERARAATKDHRWASPSPGSAYEMRP
jgi:hypothetical protein